MAGAADDGRAGEGCDSEGDDRRSCDGWRADAGGRDCQSADQRGWGADRGAERESVRQTESDALHPCGGGPRRAYRRDHRG